MGYEEPIGEVPSRDKEHEMIHNLEESWLNQSYRKLYMNEDLRRTKLEFAERMNSTRREFLMNNLLFGACTLPIFYISRRFFVNRSWMIPYYDNVGSTIKYRSETEQRMIDHAIKAVPLWMLGTVMLSYYFTNWELAEDQNYNHLGKVKKML